MRPRGGASPVNPRVRGGTVVVAIELEAAVNPRVRGGTCPIEGRDAGGTGRPLMMISVSRRVNPRVRGGTLLEATSGRNMPGEPARTRRNRINATSRSAEVRGEPARTRRNRWPAAV